MDAADELEEDRLSRAAAESIKASQRWIAGGTLSAAASASLSVLPKPTSVPQPPNDGVGNTTKTVAAGADKTTTAATTTAATTTAATTTGATTTGATTTAENTSAAPDDCEQSAAAANDSPSVSAAAALEAERDLYNCPLLLYLENRKAVRYEILDEVAQLPPAVPPSTLPPLPPPYSTSARRRVLLGRNPHADIILEFGECSRMHAEMFKVERDAGQSPLWYIRDLKSAHGTFLNSGKLAAFSCTALEDGDELLLAANSPTLVVYRSSFDSDEERVKVAGELAACGAATRRRRCATAVSPTMATDTPMALSAKRTRLQAEVASSVRCKHILLKHAQSRRPYDSYRKKPVTRSREDAMELIGDIHAQLLLCPDAFDILANEISECSSALKGGDLGFFEAHKMQQAFSEAAFKLQIGELSPLVETASGVHLILRTG